MSKAPKTSGITMFVFDPATQTIRQYPAAAGEASSRVKNPFKTMPGFGFRVARAKRALQKLGADCLAHIYTRSFDNCFEMGDGEAVVFALMQAVAAGDDLLARGIRNVGGSMWSDWHELWLDGRRADDPPRLL